MVSCCENKNERINIKAVQKKVIKAPIVRLFIEPHAIQ